jgi:TIR domain
LAPISFKREDIGEMGRVFISYRREDAAGFAGRIYDRLTKNLGRESVFIDVDNIPAGLDFVDVLSERVGRCDALVAIVGKNWLGSADKDNRRRLDDPNDYVRMEIEAALNRKIPVIPVLVDGAVMPQADDLPDGLKKLARRHGIQISHDRFETDAERLTDTLARFDGVGTAQSGADARLGWSAPPSRPPASGASWKLPAAALVVIAGSVAFYGLLGARVEQWHQPTPTSDVLKSPPPLASSPAPNETQTGSTAERAAPANAAAPAPNAADETGTGEIVKSAPAKTRGTGAPDATTALQQWTNLEDFRPELMRRINTDKMYPEKIYARCQNGEPQRRVDHWLPRSAGQYFTPSLDSEKDFNSVVTRQKAEGFIMTFDTVFEGCDGSMYHLTGWLQG